MWIFIICIIWTILVWFWTKLSSSLVQPSKSTKVIIKNIWDPFQNYLSFCVFKHTWIYFTRLNSLPPLYKDWNSKKSPIVFWIKSILCLVKLPRLMCGCCDKRELYLHFNWSGKLQEKGCDVCQWKKAFKLTTVVTMKEIKCDLLIG